MNNLQSVMEQIKKLKAVADSNAGTDVATRRFKLGKIRQAKEQLENLYMTYRREIQNNAVFIVASGTESSEFAKVASEEYQCFSVEADSFYREILNQLPEKLYVNQIASRNLFEHIAAKFEDRAKQIDIIGYQPIYFEAKYKKNLTGKEDTLDLVKRAINDKVGPEVVGLDAIEKVAIEAVNKNFKGSMVPIVLYTNDEGLSLELLNNLKRLNKNVFLVSAGESENEMLTNSATAGIKSISKEKVEETLVKIKKSVK